LSRKLSDSVSDSDWYTVGCCNSGFGEDGPGVFGGGPEGGAGVSGGVLSGGAGVSGGVLLGRAGVSGGVLSGVHGGVLSGGAGVHGGVLSGGAGVHGGVLSGGAGVPGDVLSGSAGGGGLASGSGSDGLLGLSNSHCFHRSDSDKSPGCGCCAPHNSGAAGALLDPGANSVIACGGGGEGWNQCSMISGLLAPGGSLFPSAQFVGPSSHEYIRFCDAPLPPSVKSTISTCISCIPCTDTGAASAKLTTERIRKIREAVSYRRIFVEICDMD